jgi:hypothetical protein
VLIRVDPRPDPELIRADPRPDPVLIRVDPRPDPELIRADPRKNAVATRARPWLSSCTAAAIDALVLLAVDALLILLISLSSGLGIDVLLRSSALALGGFCAIPVALYFVIFEGIAGTTLGRWIFRLIDPSPQHPLRLPDILRRSVFR